MTLVPCPHCGFQNFEISAYCGRCERPLRKAAKARATPPPRPRTTARRPRKAAVAAAIQERAPTPPPAPAESVVGGSIAAAAAAASSLLGDEPQPTPDPVAYTLPGDATPPRPVEAQAASVPVPRPPVREDATPAPLPIELDNPELPEPPPRRIDSGIKSEPVYEVILASGVRLVISNLVDLTIVVSFGVLVALLGSVLSSNPWLARTMTPWDYVATWIHVYTSAAIAGGIATVLAGVVGGAIAARFGGRTVGRMLTGTVLVRGSGTSTSWFAAIVRALASVVSAAVFGAGYFWPIIDRKHRTWHDLITGTVVVRRTV